MNAIRSYTGYSRFGPSVCAAIIAAIFLAGCSPKAPTSEVTAQGGSAVGPSPKGRLALPGTAGAVNPPEGQPNHMSPAMQAQLQQYQALAAANKK